MLLSCLSRNPLSKSKTESREYGVFKMNLEAIDLQLTSRNLRNPQLDILKPDANLYDFLLLQPKGEIEVTDQYIRGGSDAYDEKFTKFIDLARSKNVKLAITPEYSCPWSLIEKVISEDFFPTENSLWILGCQSITKDDLRKISQNSPVEVIFEEDVLNSTGNFLNPVCYLFKTRSNSNNLKRVLVIQFKVNPMGNLQDYLERNNIIRGNKVYVLKNDPDSVNLATFICSDLLDFNEDTFTGYKNLPCIFIHLQLNNNPRHQDIREYRRRFFDKKDGNKEVICLNWAKGTKITSAQEISFSGSALYIKTDEVNQDDNIVNNNHTRGLYYTYWSNRYSHNYYLNCDEGVYYCKGTKVCQRSSAPSRSKRTGPEAMEVYNWNNSSNNWVLVIPDDGLIGLCGELNCDAPSLINNDLSPLEKERLLTLSCGKISGQSDGKSNWHDLKQLDFFKVTDSEIIKRITFTHDDATEAKGHRNEVVFRFSELNKTVIKNPTNFPDCVKDLRDNSHIGYFSEDNTIKYNCNLFPVNGGSRNAPATVAFLGSSTEKIARKMFDSIASWIGTYLIKRLVIWYRKDDGNIYSECIKRKPKVEDVYMARNSINRDE